MSQRDIVEAAFARLGFTVTGGGTHPHLGTRNRLLLLGEGYVELLAIAEAARVSPALTRRLAAGAGWVGFALQSADIAADVLTMRGRGIAVWGPSVGRLVAPNGMVRGWRVATLRGADLWAAAEPLPFLIQHDTSGEQHQRELAGAGGLAAHANGARSLAEVAVATRDLDAAGRRFARAYDLVATDAVRPDLTLNADVLALTLASGERLVLAHPTGPGIAQRRLGSAGEGVCRVSIAVADVLATAAFLRGRGIPCDEETGALAVDAAVSGGAAVRFVSAGREDGE